MKPIPRLLQGIFEIDFCRILFFEKKPHRLKITIESSFSKKLWKLIGGNNDSMKFGVF